MLFSDLKKLIKYDLQHKNEGPNTQSNKLDIIGPERLHSASTFSSRTRSKIQSSNNTCNRCCQPTRKSNNIRTTYSAPTFSNNKLEEKSPRRACSCVRIENKKDKSKEPPKAVFSSNNCKFTLKI